MIAALLGAAFLCISWEWNFLLFAFETNCTSCSCSAFNESSSSILKNSCIDLLHDTEEFDLGLEA